MSHTLRWQPLVLRTGRAPKLGRRKNGRNVSDVKSLDMMRTELPPPCGAEFMMSKATLEERTSHILTSASPEWLSSPLDEGVAAAEAQRPMERMFSRDIMRVHLSPAVSLDAPRPVRKISGTVIQSVDRMSVHADDLD